MSFSAATITASTGTVKWSNNSPFNGYILLTTNLPGGYTTLKKASVSPAQRLPLYIRIPIADGVIHSASQIPFTSSVEPPGCTYSFVIYDSNDRLIASGASPFTVTATPVALTVPTLTAP